MGRENIKHTEVDWCIYNVYTYVHFCINYTYIKWLTWQPDWSKKCVPCQSGVCGVWIWCDSVCFCHATQIDIVLPNGSTAHMVTQILLYFFYCQRTKFNFLQLMILERFKLWCHHLAIVSVAIPVQDWSSKTWHHLGRKCTNINVLHLWPGSVLCRHCRYVVSDVGQSSAAGGPQWGSEPGLSGSEGKRGCSLYNPNSFECFAAIMC